MTVGDWFFTVGWARNGTDPRPGIACENCGSEDECGCNEPNREQGEDDEDDDES
jgi:hypothetical protein